MCTSLNAGLTDDFLHNINLLINHKHLPFVLRSSVVFHNIFENNLPWHVWYFNLTYEISITEIFKLSSKHTCKIKLEIFIFIIKIDMEIIKHIKLIKIDMEIIKHLKLNLFSIS